MVGEAYGGAYCAMIPGARFETIEAPAISRIRSSQKVFAERVLAFAGGK